MRLLAGRFAQRWKLPAGDWEHWEGGAAHTHPPARYRLRERAALAPNKGMGEGWGEPGPG